MPLWSSDNTQAPKKTRESRKGKVHSAFDELAQTDAFELREGFPLTFTQTAALTRVDARALRIKIALMLAVLLVAGFASLSIGVTYYEFYSPLEVLSVFATWFKLTFDSLFLHQIYSTEAIMEMCPYYYQVMSRLGITLLSMACGCMLSLSGMLYQAVFRNPIAAPTMLGVSNGVNLGIIALVLVYGTGAYYEPFSHYAYCYIGSIAVLLLVFGVGWLVSGRQQLSIVDLLLVGSIISQLLGQVVLYFSYFVFDDYQWTVYTQLNEVLTVDTDPIAYTFLAVAFFVTFIPALLLRYRFNAVCFSAIEARFMGVRTERLRVIALVLATIMVIAAMVHSGMIGMIALVVPFVSRGIFGAEISKQTLGNVVLGALLLLVCRDVTDIIDMCMYWWNIPITIPIGVISSCLCLPLFVWILALQQRTWE